MKKLRVSLSIDTIAKDIRYDSRLFATQLYRRFSRPRLTQAISTILPYLPSTHFRNLCASIIDRPDLTEEEHKTSTPTAIAHELYRTGQLSQAIDCLPDSALANAWKAERRILEGTSRLLIPSSHTPTRDTCASSSISILHLLNSSLPFSQSGYTIRSHRLLQAQEKIGIQTYNVTRPGYPVIIGHPFVSPQTTVDDITYHHLLPTSRPYPLDKRIEQHTFLLHTLLQQQDSISIDALHITSDYTNGIAGQAYARALNRPWIYEMRGMRELSWLATFPIDAQETVRRSEKFHLWQTRETELARHADAVVVLSEIQKNNLIDRGVDEQSIWVIPHTYDISPDTPLLTQAQAREQLGLPAAEVYFGSITSFVDYEGLDTLIHTLAALRAKGVDAQLALVGSGTAAPQLRALAHELSVDEHVIFPGKVTLEQSHLWYQALDFFAVPRRDTPVCRLVTPLKPFEALAYGRPLLTSHLPPLTELTRNGLGISIDSDCPDEWATSIERHMPNTSSYTKMSTYAFDFARRTSWEKNAHITEEMYRKIL